MKRRLGRDPQWAFVLCRCSRSADLLASRSRDLRNIERVFGGREREPSRRRQEPAAHTAGRNLERIADHAVIVGKRVGYMLTGDTGSLAAEIR